MRAENDLQLAAGRRAAWSAEEKEETGQNPKPKHKKKSATTGAAGAGGSEGLHHSKSGGWETEGRKRELTGQGSHRKVLPAPPSTQRTFRGHGTPGDSDEDIKSRSTSRSSSSGDKSVPVRVTAKRMSSSSMEVAPPSPAEEPKPKPKLRDRLLGKKKEKRGEKKEKKKDAGANTESVLRRFLSSARGEKDRAAEEPLAIPTLNEEQPEVLPQDRQLNSAPGGSLVLRKKIKASLFAPPPFKMWNSAPGALTSPGALTGGGGSEDDLFPKPKGWVHRLKKKVAGKK